MTCMMNLPPRQSWCGSDGSSDGDARLLLFDKRGEPRADAAAAFHVISSGSWNRPIRDLYELHIPPETQ